MGSVAAICVVLGAGSACADPLADLRRDLERLKSDLVTMDADINQARTQRPVLAGSLLEQMSAIEAEVQRLTNVLEHAEYQTRASAAQIDALETRLCALEENCDPAATTQALVSSPPPLPKPLAPAVRARAEGRLEEALILLASFGAQQRPLVEQIAALSLQSEILQQMDRYEAAAKAALDGYGFAPEGPYAANFLLTVGLSFEALGKAEETCLMVGEVAAQFPASDVRGVADDFVQTRGCM